MGSCFTLIFKKKQNQDSLLDSSHGSEYSRSQDSSVHSADDPTFQQENEQFNSTRTETIFIKKDNKKKDTVVEKVSIETFNLIKVLGKGSFGKVMLVERKDTKELYAMKILKKAEVSKRNQKIHTQAERQILEQTTNPFIVDLHYAFQNEQKLYMVMDFMQGGELFFHLRKSYKFNEKRAKFYAAELILALEYCHDKGIVYRDLKPENILLGVDGHLKITDFGLSKQGIGNKDKTYTFCGTPEYLAPEILQGKGGALLYEMLSGAPPFYSKDRRQMLQNILEKPIQMKPYFSQEASSILQGLLTQDPRKRLGSSDNDSQELKQHPFFKEIDWQKVLQKQYDPPFKPKVMSERDLRHFDKMFTDETVKDTPVIDLQRSTDNYPNFTYVKKEVNDDGALKNYQNPQPSDDIIENPNFDFVN